ncbi:MAG: ABC transporter ATP-binding protein/permease [Patescibacteria group bacterium]|nr:ABC transporter ATP-binding protein/permease [Patescibacteria group bacterium]
MIYRVVGDVVKCGKYLPPFPQKRLKTMAAYSKKHKLPLEGVRAVFKHLAPHRHAIVLLSSLSVAAAVTGTAIPYLAGKIIDAIVKPSAIAVLHHYVPTALFFVAAWGLTNLVYNIVSWQIDLRQTQVSAVIEADYLVNGFGRLLELPMSFHKNHKIGDSTDRINRAARYLDNIISNVLINLAPQILSVFGAIIITMIIKPTLSLLLLLALVIYIFILLRVVPRMAKIQRTSYRLYNQAYGDMYEAVFNVQSVKQAVAEEYERRKMHRNFHLRAVKFWQAYMQIWQSVSFTQRILILAVQILIYAFAITQIFKGSMTIGDLVMFNGYAAMFFGPFAVLASNWQSIQSGLVALERAEKIINLPTEKYAPSAEIMPTRVEGGVEFDKVSFGYRGRQKMVLKNINFTIQSGQTIALVGESGVGKTTLIDLVSNYVKPTKGKVYLDGNNIQNLDLKFLRGNIAVVPQEILLFNDTVKTTSATESSPPQIKRYKQPPKKLMPTNSSKNSPKNTISWSGNEESNYRPAKNKG